MTTDQHLSVTPHQAPALGVGDPPTTKKRAILNTPILRRLAVALTGIGLLLSGALLAAPAHAQDLRVRAETITSGSLSVNITVSGCTSAAGAVYQVWDQADEPVTEPAPVPSATFTWTASNPGVYKVEVHCLAYNGVDVAATAWDSFGVGLIVLFMDPGTWSSGDQVSISGSGFLPGAAVRLELWSAGNGKRLVQTWATTANSSGNLAFSVAWPSAASDGSALPLGAYAILAIAGDRQGDVQFAQSSAGKWGPLAVPDKGDKNNKGTNTKKKGGLPKTGN